VISISLDAQTGGLQICSLSARSKAMQKTQEEDEVIGCFPKKKKFKKKIKLETSLWFNPISFSFLVHFE
jgi:hypothetical protein